MLGISINLITGDNGILNRAQKASEKTKQATLKEELEVEIADLQFKLAEEENGRPLRKDEIVDKFNNIGAEVIESTDTSIEGEYKGYEYTVDENNKVTIGGALTGAVPTAIFELSTTQEGVEELDLKVIASTTEGEIASIETLDGLDLVSENGTSEKTYKVQMNGEYKFKIIGTNKRRATVATTIKNLENVLVSESLLAGIGTINKAGETKIRVKGKLASGDTTTENYTINVVYHKGNLSIGDKLTSGGSEITVNELSKASATEWRVGKAGDVNTNSVVLKVDGDLTLESGYTLTSVKSGTNGGKGLFVYCTGQITLNGNIDMQRTSCTAASQNVYLWKKVDDSYVYIAKSGRSRRTWSRYRYTAKFNSRREWLY